MKHIFLLLLLCFSCYSQKIELMLLEEYKNQDIDGYLMSEKLDGVRAYWTGKYLISRNGNIFNAPNWFLEGFPKYPLDGELYTKKGDFENIISIVSKKYQHYGWKDIKYYVFDAPSKNGGLLERLSAISNIKAPYLEIIEHLTCKNKEDLYNFFNQIVLDGGEGVVLRDPTISYVPKRTSFNLKLKPTHDDECIIVELHKEHNVSSSRIKSFTCKLKNDDEIKIGSGLNETLRNKNTLQEGTVITFKYNGLSNSGKPKFPTFLRIRDDL